MRFNEFRMIAIIVLFGVIWSIIPWDPLSMVDSCIAAVCVLVVSSGTVCYVEYLVKELINKIIPG